MPGASNRNGGSKPKPAQAPKAPKAPTDKMTSIAGKITGAGDPLDNPAVIGAIAEALGRNGFTRRVAREESVTADSLPLLAEGLRAVLGPYLHAGMSLAGCVLGLDQKKGPGTKAD